MPTLFLLEQCGLHVPVVVSATQQCSGPLSSPSLLRVKHGSLLELTAGRSQNVIPFLTFLDSQAISTIFALPTHHPFRCFTSFTVLILCMRLYNF